MDSSNYRSTLIITTYKQDICGVFVLIKISRLVLKKFT